LLTSTSRRPKRSIVAATHARAPSTSPAFAAKTATSPGIVAAAASSPSSLRLDSITCAPAAAYAVAIALPIPFEAPVMSATLPSNRSSTNAGP
jgi:hypothetical protein